MGTHDGNKKAGIPTTTGIPASTTADYRGNFGLEAVDRWIRTARAFDGVLNLARAVADVDDGRCEPSAMFEPYDSGDHLHPNAAGQTAMANAVNTRLFGLPDAPRLPPMIAVKATPGCRG